MQINSITPRLIVPNPDDSIDFYREVFDAKLNERYEQDGIVVHAGLHIDEWEFSISAEVQDWGWLAPTTLGGSAMLLSLDVDDAREVADRMAAAGAEVLVPVEDRPYGQCEGRVRDPFGHLWIPTQKISEASEIETPDNSLLPGVRRIVADLTVGETAASIEFFRQLLDLNPVMDLGWVATLTPSGEPDRQLTLMTDDATASLNPQLSVEVDDLDVVWERAQELGAKIVHYRTLEPWGVERFFVADPSGNIINILSHVDAADVGR